MASCTCVRPAFSRADLRVLRKTAYRAEWMDFSIAFRERNGPRLLPQLRIVQHGLSLKPMPVASQLRPKWKPIRHCFLVLVFGIISRADGTFTIPIDYGTGIAQGI